MRRRTGARGATATAERPLLRVHVLDRFSVVRAGKERPLRGRPAELLRALIGLGGRDVPEARLQEALWPETDEDRAHQAFATNLHRLRRLLGRGEVLILREGRLTLHGGHCWVDAWALERALGEAEASWVARGDPAEGAALRCAERALGLLRGPLFGAHPDERWIAPLRERLLSRTLRCAERLGLRLEALGRDEEALACWQRGLEANGLAEGLCRRLMACLGRLGRGAEALAAYQRFCALARASLDTVPSPETRELAERLRRGEGAAGAAPRATR